MFIRNPILNHPRDRLIQKSLREWLDISSWKAPCSLTLTMKQYRREWSGSRPVTIFLSTSIAEQNLRHFLNLLNRRLMTRSEFRQGRRLPVIPFLEGGDRKRVHYHLAIDRPPNVTLGEFSDEIEREWSKTHWGDERTELKTADNGWVNYMTKLADKSVFSDAFDCANASLPDLIR
jgi:hypothetical protein